MYIKYCLGSIQLYTKFGRKKKNKKLNETRMTTFSGHLKRQKKKTLKHDVTIGIWIKKKHKDDTRI